MTARARSQVAAFLPLTLASALGIALLLVWELHVDFLVAWLIGVNGVAGLAYAYDKAIAGSRRTRIPERVLHLLAAVGATPAAFVSMRLLRHKTSKPSFQKRFWLIAAGQAALLVGFFLVIKPLLPRG